MQIIILARLCHITRLTEREFIVLPKLQFVLLLFFSIRNRDFTYVSLVEHQLRNPPPDPLGDLDLSTLLSWSYEFRWLSRRIDPKHSSKNIEASHAATLPSSSLSELLTGRYSFGSKSVVA